MTEIIIAVLFVALLLYVLLGGADFGAGIVELLTGKKGINTISKAIAPVWEANHVWIILAIVILFNGFPLVYTVMSTYLHIPLLLVLIGIIIRGSAFTFRYYDVNPEIVTYTYYSWFFRIASLLTPFFLGIVFGAIILGKIPPSPEGSFTEIFIKPWVNLFTISTGFFTMLLFAWLASVYLIGETDVESFPLFMRTSTSLFVLLIVSGLFVFITSEYYQVNLLKKFSHSAVSIASVVLATILIPILWISITNRNIFRTRLIAGIQTTCIMAGWFAVQFPVMINISNGKHLTIWNSQAPEATMRYLLYALVIGVIIIFPAFGYLFKVFKFNATPFNKNNLK